MELELNPPFQNPESATDTLKQQLQEGQKDGPYQACIKFAEIQSMVQEQFTTFRMTTQETSKILRQAFPGARSERSTFVFGVRRRWSTSAGHEVGALSLPVRPVQWQI